MGRWSGWTPRAGGPDARRLRGATPGTRPQGSHREFRSFRNPAAPPTASTGRFATCASRLPIAATSGAATACPKRSTCGCRGHRFSASRRSTGSRESWPGSASPSYASPAASRFCATTCRRSSRFSSGHAAITDLALTTNGILLARQAAALRAAGLAPGHGQPRHAAPRADAGVRPQRSPCRRDRRNRLRAGGWLRVGQVEHRGHPGLQRRRSGGPAGIRPWPGSGAAVHRVHGRGWRHRMVDGSGGLAA